MMTPQRVREDVVKGTIRTPLADRIQTISQQIMSRTRFEAIVTDLNLYRENLGAIGAAYREVFGRHYPAATLVEVSSLFDPAAMVEVEAVAVRQR